MARWVTIVGHDGLVIDLAAIESVGGVHKDPSDKLFKFLIWGKSGREYFVWNSSKSILEETRNELLALLGAILDPDEIEEDIQHMAKEEITVQ